MNILLFHLFFSCSATPSIDNQKNLPKEKEKCHWSTSLCATTPTSDAWYVLVVYTTTFLFFLLRTCSAHVSLNEEKKCTTKGTIRPRLRAPSFKVICIVAMVLRNLLCCHAHKKALWKLRSADIQLRDLMTSSIQPRPQKSTVEVTI